MAETQVAPDARMGGLSDKYEIRGELRGTDAVRTYIGRPRDGSAEVAITVVSVPAGAQNNELSHYAADIKILETTSHPSLVQVLDGRWIGKDQFAVVTERLRGESLAELLDRGDRFTNPRMALLLQDVSGVLDWAREKGIVHRTVTPDSVFVERDTNRMRVMFVPAPLPIDGVPMEAGDARTLGALAWAMFTGERYDATTSPKSLGDVAPNLATRVIEATNRAIACKDGSTLPDVATFLGIIGSGDVLKQAEVEMAAMKEEYDEAHRREIQKCELQRQAVEQKASEQMSALAGEREEFVRKMADERAATASERAQFEQMMTERRERLAAVRAELDAQRAEMERRLAELEAYRVEVEKARDNAMAMAEKARHDAIAETERWRAQILAASTAAATTPEAAIRAANSIPTPAKHVDIPKVPIPAAPKALKEMKAPKWDKRMEKLDVSDEELIAGNGRMKFIVPAGVATVALIAIAAVYGVMHRSPSSDVVRVGNSKVVASPPSVDSGMIPRGGFLSQPTAQSNAQSAPQTSPLVTPPAPGAVTIDSAAGAVSRTPITPTPARSTVPATSTPGTSAPVTSAPTTTAPATVVPPTTVPPTSAPTTQVAPTPPRTDSVRRPRETNTAASTTAPSTTRHRPSQREVDSVNTMPTEWSKLQRSDSIMRARREAATRDSTRRDTLPRPDTTSHFIRH